MNLQMRRTASFFAAYRACSVWTFMEASKPSEDEESIHELTLGWGGRLRSAQSWSRFEDYSIARSVPIVVEINRLNERRFRFLP